MNTKQLQKTFPNIYQEFFQQHELVFSCPFVTNRSGDILGNFAGIPIRQKLPLRMYLGISAKGATTTLANIQYYDHLEEVFHTEDLSAYFSVGAKFFQNATQNYQGEGFTISIISECSRSLGLGFTSIFNILLTTALHYYQKKLSKEEIDAGKSAVINTILRGKQSGIQDIFEQTTLFEISTGGDARLTPKIASFFDGAGPIVAFREDNAHETNQLHWSTSVYGFRFHELWPDQPEFESLHADFAILYSGRPLTKERVDDAHLEKVPFLEAKQSLKSVLDHRCQNLSIDRQPKFYKYLLAPNNDVISSLYGQLMGTISIEIASHLRQLIKDPCEQEFYSLLHTLNKFKHAHYITRINSLEYYKLLQNIELKHQDLGFSQKISNFPIESTISGGCFGLLAEFEHIKAHKTQLLQCYKILNHNIKLIYSNREDGYECNGFRIEQDISIQVDTPYAKRVKYKLTNRDGSVHLKNYEEGINDRNNDIILDYIKKKIYILGEPCNSKTLHSQSATIELLCKVIQEKGATFNSRLLPSSSYSKNKSDMIHKVMIPFDKLLKEKLGRSFKAKCHGYISSYNIECNIDDLKIGILQEI